MAYIYKITNLLNQKSYIGKTEFSPKKRFAEHIRNRERFPERPLSRAINKYGIENFSFEVLEKTDTPEEREIYYIQFYTSYGSSGYNATLGGDGKKLFDYDEIINSYEKTQSTMDTAIECNCHPSTVRMILKEKDIVILGSPQVIKNKYGKPVQMFELNNSFLRSFRTLGEAAQYMIDSHLTNCKLDTIRTHISEVCRGKRQTAAKFKWKFEENK